MTLVIIIFFISILVAFGMLFFRIWEFRTSRKEFIKIDKSYTYRIQFRHIEKNVLYLTKYVVQKAIFGLAKYWFIFITKMRKNFNEKLPKINSYLKKKQELNTPYRHSFIKKAVFELKEKIKRIKEKVKEEIE